MRAIYSKFRDVLWIHKRFTASSFNSFPLLFCGVNETGRTLIFGSSMITHDDSASYTFALEHFRTSLCQNGLEPPGVIVIERNNLLKVVIEKTFENKVRVIYCKQHYQKSVQHYLGNYTPQNEEEFAEAEERINGLFVIDNKN